MWKAAAVIVDNLDTSKLIDCNPFYDVDELREEGFKVVKKLRKSEGYSSDEPVTFKISPNETYIDFYDYDEDEETTGVYFGQDGLADFLADLYTPEDDDYDDYEF